MDSEKTLERCCIKSLSEGGVLVNISMGFAHAIFIIWQKRRDEIIVRHLPFILNTLEIRCLCMMVAYS